MTENEEPFPWPGSTSAAPEIHPPRPPPPPLPPPSLRRPTAADFLNYDDDDEPAAGASTSASVVHATAGLEDGELEEANEGPPSRRPLPVAYDDPTLYAFPDDDNAPSASTTTSETAATTAPTLRLVRLKSTVLPPAHTLALLSPLQPDGFTVGRDKPVTTATATGYIRLREMAISRAHAVIYYALPEPGAGAGAGAGVGGWKCVDLGSTHGTFLKKKRDGFTKMRLSEAKVASLPKELEHLDRLKLGSTELEVHLHPHPGLPCPTCSLTSTSALIPTSSLISATDPPAASSSSSSSMTIVRPATNNTIASAAKQPALNPKESLKRLKDSLLAFKTPPHPSAQPSPPPAKRLRPSPSSAEGPPSPAANDPSPAPPKYLNRAALRRQAYPSSTSEAPSPPPPLLPPPPVRAAAPAQTAAVPLPSSNIGYRLLLKQGWAGEGTALGSVAGRAASVAEAEGGGGGRGLVVPVEVEQRRAGEGLGVVPRREGEKNKNVEAGGGDWREEGRERRWREMGLR